MLCMATFRAPTVMSSTACRCTCNRRSTTRSSFIFVSICSDRFYLRRRFLIVFVTVCACRLSRSQRRGPRSAARRWRMGRRRRRRSCSRWRGRTRTSRAWRGRCRCGRRRSETC
ncbi:hypothetical protein DAI22_02g272600 [Oryza sativa Japonica Group]|nr:hypothetical protein DAI22_02g272600 [Oryza sativa Japonica Group]